MFHRFKLDRDDIWQNASTSKYASTDVILCRKVLPSAEYTAHAYAVASASSSVYSSWSIVHSWLYISLYLSFVQWRSVLRCSRSATANAPQFLALHPRFYHDATKMSLWIILLPINAWKSEFACIVGLTKRVMKVSSLTVSKLDGETMFSVEDHKSFGALHLSFGRLEPPRPPLHFASVTCTWLVHECTRLLLNIGLNFLTVFPDKGWTKNNINRLLVKLRKFGTVWRVIFVTSGDGI